MKRYMIPVCCILMTLGILYVLVLPTMAEAAPTDIPVVSSISNSINTPAEPETTDDFTYFISLYKKAGGCGSVIESAALVSIAALAAGAYAIRKKRR